MEQVAQNGWRKALILGFALAAALLASVHAQAAGLLRPSASGLPPLEIRDHEVDVVVEDGYAVVTIEQVFANPHNQDLEAIYSFPVPEKAAVSEFTYWIDGKPVVGEVLPKDKARTLYESEKSAGREAGLAEQDSYKTFDMSVWPVRAGQDVRIRLSYIQPAHVDTGVGRWVYPLEEGGVDEAKLAFWTANEAVTGRFSFDLALRSAYPIEALRLPAHPQAIVRQEADGTWRVHLDNGAPVAAVVEEGTGAVVQPASVTPNTQLDQDIVVYWRHRQGLPGRVEMIAHKTPGAERGTFMVVVTPGDDLKFISEGSDWVFVLDKSGSMGGKWHTLLEGVAQGLRQLRPEDRFRILVFDDAALPLTGGFQPATPEAVRAALDKLRNLQPSNSTNLYAGLNMGLNGLDDDRTAAILLVTDGVANVGETRQRAFLDLVNKQDVRLFTFVMGNSANRPLLDAMTRESGGTAISISNSDDVVGAVLTATSKVSHEAMHDVVLEIDGVRTADLNPAKPGSLYRGQQLVLFGHYWGDGPADVALKAKISGQPVVYKTRFDFPTAVERNPEVERLWAFAAIETRMQELADFGADKDLEQAVVDLAVEYGLVTPYTSMVVLREEIFEQMGIARTNRDRVATEQQAQNDRAQQQVVDNRVDQSQPMFQSPQASYSGGGNSGNTGNTGNSGGSSGGGGIGIGGGAIGPWGFLLVLIPALFAVFRPARR